MQFISNCLTEYVIDKHIVNAYERLNPRVVTAGCVCTCVLQTLEIN